MAALATGVISSSRAINQPSSGNDGSGRSDIPDPVVASSPPQCPPCWKPVEFAENFDGVMPPMLPLGWVATNVQGPPPMWVTSNSGVPSPPADTLPNAAFIDDPGVISDKLLDLPGLTVFETISQQLTFRHNFNLEASAEDPNLGFDGGVLEISVDQGKSFTTSLRQAVLLLQAAITAPSAPIVVVRLPVGRLGAATLVASSRPRFTYLTIL